MANLINMRIVPCPSCGAHAGDPCVGTSKPDTVHALRVRDSMLLHLRMHDTTHGPTQIPMGEEEGNPDE